MARSNPSMTKNSVWFESGGTRCAGQLYRRDDATDHIPLVVMCHGVGGTADRLQVQATSLAQAGFAALAIDYRGFGHSGGTPRHVLDLAAHRADLRSAITAARRLPGIDPARIALWGVSAGGAHVVHVAAEGAPVVGVIAQVPFNGFPKKVEGRSAWQTLRLFGVILDDRLRHRLGRSPHYIPMVARPGKVALVTTRDAVGHVESLGAGTTWPNEIAPGGTLDMIRYRPSDLADRIRVPLLVCIAEHDMQTPFADQIAARAPRGELKSYPATHMDFYGDPELWSRVVADQIEFLHRCFAEDVHQTLSRRTP